MSKSSIAWISVVLVLTAGCSSRRPVVTAPVDRQLEEFNAAGRIAFEMGKYDLAARSYERALHRAYARDDAAAASDSAYNIAAALSRQRAFAPALDRLDEARFLAPVVSSNRIAAIDTLGVAILLEINRFDAADKVLAEALARPQLSAGSRRLLLLYQADLAIRLDKRGLADKRMAVIQGIDASNPAELVIRARYAHMQDDHGMAAERFILASELYREMIHYTAMAQALAAAAAARSRAEDQVGAANLWFRAARSAQFQGFNDWAEIWRTKAHKAALAADDAPLRAKIEKWTGEDREPRDK